MDLDLYSDGSVKEPFREKRKEQVVHRPLLDRHSHPPSTRGPFGPSNRLY